MIALHGITKSYHVGGLPTRRVLDNVSVVFPTGRNVGVLGLNGAGKSTLIRLLSGTERPDSGSIKRSRSVSFPLGLASIFHPDLTGRENIAFVARVYDLGIERVADYVAWFAEIGSYLDAPVKYYSSGMMAKLAFGLCLAIDFDVYLIDEVTEVGDGVFREKAAREFRARADRSDLVVVSHNVDTIREYCNLGAILHNGQIEMFEDVEDALTQFRMTIMAQSAAPGALRETGRVA